MAKLDDMDKAFSYGTIFGIGIAAATFFTKELIIIVRRMKSSRNALRNVCAEIDMELQRETGGEI